MAQKPPDFTRSFERRRQTSVGVPVFGTILARVRCALGRGGRKISPGYLPSGRGARRCLSELSLQAVGRSARVALTGALAWALVGCVVPAPENADASAPTASLQILPNQAIPDVFKDVTVQVNGNKATMQFSILAALKQSNAKQPLSYYWLIDFDESKQLKVNAFNYFDCLDSHTCLVDFCTVQKLPPPLQEQHRLRVVVADARFKSDATKPLDFPAGSVFDSVDWTIKMQGSCP